MSKEGLAYFQHPPPDKKKKKEGGDKLYVHFNPTSLRVALTNQFGEDPPDQHARATTAKLDVEVIFDTTETGEDVRQVTELLRTWATASGGTSGKKGSGKKDEANKSLPLTVFHWGTTHFVGVIESLNETLDYWSSDGVPLRATLQVAMKGSGLETDEKRQAAGVQAKEEFTELPDFTPAEALPGETGTTGAATQAGDSKAGRSLAAANGLENMRAPTGASFAAGAGASLAAAAGFQMSGGVSAGAAAGFGIGASAGASAAAGLGAGVGVGMAAGAGFGAGAGAGFGASAGAFAGAGAGAFAGAGFGASAGAFAGAGAGAGVSFGASAGAFAGAGAVAGAGAFAGSGAGFSSGTFAGAGAGALPGLGFGGGAGAGFAMGSEMSLGGGGFGISTSSTTSVTGFDGATRTETHSTFTDLSGRTSSSFSYASGSPTAGVSASYGAFAGLGTSKTVMASGVFDPNAFLGPPLPAPDPFARFETSGRLLPGGGQVAASYSYSHAETVRIF